MLRSNGEFVGEVLFSPDSKLLATVEGETVRFWRVEASDLTELACPLVGRNLTPDEWSAFLPGEEPDETCIQWDP